MKWKGMKEEELKHTEPRIIIITLFFPIHVQIVHQRRGIHCRLYRWATMVLANNRIHLPLPIRVQVVDYTHF